MSNYDNTNSGALFQAKEKRTPKSPDYSGSINANGVDFFVSGWKKTDRNGKPYLSLALTPKNQQQNNQNSQGSHSQNHSQGEPPMDFDDDIPF